MGQLGGVGWCWRRYLHRYIMICIYIYNDMYIYIYICNYTYYMCIYIILCILCIII